MTHASQDIETIYTCPMHPEVRQNGPGRCPICGMHLVPEGQATRDHQYLAPHAPGSGAVHQGTDHRTTQGAVHHHGHSAAALHDHDTAAAPVPGTRYDIVPPGWAGTVYTCPMHPEVRQIRPGSCPICGMGLERDAVTATDDGPNPELVDFTRRFWVGVVLTVPLLILTMGPLVGLSGVREIFGERPTMWIELILGTPVVL